MDAMFEPIFGEDALDQKTYPDPIQTGAEVPGALMFVLKTISKEELQKDEAKVTLYFSDNTGREYSTVWTPGPPTSPYKYLPGFKRQRKK